MQEPTPGNLSTTRGKPFDPCLVDVALGAEAQILAARQQYTDAPLAGEKTAGRT